MAKEYDSIPMENSVKEIIQAIQDVESAIAQLEKESYAGLSGQAKTAAESLRSTRIATLKATLKNLYDCKAVLEGKIKSLK